MKFLRLFLLLISCYVFTECAKETEKPSYLSYQIENDSLYISVKNPLECPIFLTYRKIKNDERVYVDFDQKELKNVLSFSTSEMDTVQLYDYFEFEGLRYGKSDLQSYDSLYNYGLPFLKGKQYKILQGQNTNFTHKGDFSRYAIDFKMNVGQTVCAMRDGVVVKTVSKYNKGGSSQKYRDYANLVVLYHEDGLFSQYVHLKKNGVLVQVGDSVKKGQPIGYSGNTGMSTEPHLHFAVYKPTKTGLVSIPYLLDSIPTERYKKGKYAVNN
jgi:murein DD-endopeptidase MepM/ murein hydrolase activator NlpD